MAVSVTTPTLRGCAWFQRGSIEGNWPHDGCWFASRQPENWKEKQMRDRGVLLGFKLWVVLLGVAFPVTLAPQEIESSGSYPAEFVLAVLGLDADDIVVGGLSERAQERIPMLPEAIVLGTIESSRLNVIARVAGAPEKVESAYSSLLEAKGWTAHSEREQRGFVAEAREIPKMYCGQADELINFEARAVDKEPTILSVRLRVDPSGMWCQRMQEVRYRDPRHEVPFPTLVAPEGAKIVGTSAGGGMAREESARINTELSISDLYSHYMHQIEEQGWGRLNSCQQTGVGVQTLLFEDEDGTVWEGLLIITQFTNNNEWKTITLRVSPQDEAPFPY